MASDDLTMWGIGTSRTLRVHWMLMELGLDYAFHAIQSRTGETRSEQFLKLNPKHKIPVLQHGPLVLTESPAIVAYLSETFPPPADFFVPSDTVARARLNELCFFVMMELDAISLYVIRRHGDLSDIYGKAPRAVESAKEYFVDLSGALLKKLPADFETLMPEGMSIADILLVTCLAHAQVCGIPLAEPLPAYRARIAQRPAFRRAFARNFPGRRLEDAS